VKRIVGLLMLVATLAPVPAVAKSTPAPAAGRYIVLMRSGTSGASAMTTADALGAKVYMRYGAAVNGYAAVLSSEAVEALRANPSVLMVSPDRTFQATQAQIPQFITAGEQRVRVERSSTVSGNGHGRVSINVAVIDSGIQPNHPDLNVVGGHSCFKSPSYADTAGHGTLVAGFIGAKDNKIGVVGVAPGANLYAVRVLNRNESGSESQVICGVDWVTSTREDANPTNDIQIANMSLTAGGRDDHDCGLKNNDALHFAICRSVAAGVTYVVGAGNDHGAIERATPAAYHEVLTAAAIADYNGLPGGGAPFYSDCGAPILGRDDHAAAFSNFATSRSGAAHIIAAPGVCLSSTFLGNWYGGGVSGTSFATPIVAGTVALCIWDGRCGGTPQQIIATFLRITRHHDRAHPGYGFIGDPLHPRRGRYYGYLDDAGIF
jgi:subtilisin